MEHIAIAIVGMTNSGKTTFATRLRSHGFHYVRFGEITEEYLKQEELENTEENNREMREKIRREHGPAAYAILNLPKIQRCLKQGNTVLDGLYSWSEYKLLNSRLPGMITVAVYAPPKIRYERAKTRSVRSTKDFFKERAPKERDYAEIENIEKGGPIAMADYTIRNDVQGLKQLDVEFERFWRWLQDGYKTQLG